MCMAHRMLTALALALLLAPSVAAQDSPTTPAKLPAELSILVGERTVKFAPLKPYQEMRLAVYNLAGELLYDSGVYTQAGALDWNLQTASGAPLAPGLYRYTLWLKLSDEQSRQHQGHLILEQSQDRLWLTTDDYGDRATRLTGGALTVARTGDLTIAGAGERGTLQRDAAPRSVAEPSELAQKNSAGGGLGPPVKTTIPDDLTINGNIIFTPQLSRDLTVQNNSGGIRIFANPILTTTPASAAIQFFGNGHPGFPGQAYIDAGANDNAAVIFRSAPTGGTITERFRINAAGNVGIGTNAPTRKLHVKGNTAAQAMIRAENASTGANSAALSAYMTGTSGLTFGLYSENPSITDDASAVWGNATGTTGVTNGLFGRNDSDNGNGVKGEVTLDSGNSYAVYGLTPNDNGNAYAGYFQGKVFISGNVEKSGGSFKIDHPLDPENKYLYHSFVESPDMKNIYDGTVSTDTNGEAEVTLPDWFGALNSDFRYQLTVIGTFAQAIVAEEISDNHFKIKTSLPNVKVSWQVTGIRQDGYARKNRIQVEEAKPANERGSYLHPDVFGQPEEKGLQWKLRPEAMKASKAARDKAQRQVGGEKEKP